MNIRPSIYLTADTHFGHQKMFDWGHRSESHNEDIVNNWNETISKQDVILHLGDLTMTNKETTLEWTSQLKGRKYLVRGNHDGSSDTWFKDCGFEIIPACYKKFKDKYDNPYHVLFTHEPVITLPDEWFNIHGHLHGNNHRSESELTTERHYDVGVDAHSLTPVKLTTILEVFKQQLKPTKPSRNRL